MNFARNFMFLVVQKTKGYTMITGWVPGLCTLPVSQYWLALQHERRLMTQRQTRASRDESPVPENTHTWPIIDRLDTSGLRIFYDQNRDPRLGLLQKAAKATS